MDGPYEASEVHVFNSVNQADELFINSLSAIVSDNSLTEIPNDCNSALGNGACRVCGCLGYERSNKTNWCTCGHHWDRHN